MDQVAGSLVEAGSASAPVVFRRSPAAQLGGTFGPAVGAILFGGFALVMFSGALVPDLAPRMLFGGLLSFFAVLMGASAMAALRRGSDTRVAEVGPDGLWTPELGHVAWSELAQVRMESIAGPTGPRNSRVRQYRRLGLVPLDATRLPASAAGLALGMTQGYLALLRRLAPDADLGTARLAPFGINETELPRDFDRLVELTRAYVAVAEGPSRQA